ncbi:bactofilin family protein [Luteimonas vadosa]|uniref:Polymer-forming cytoskeletal protein n=1 Tax=Luteimonas vadosa TaxID=1165507 RepID=A0ABP9E4K6_9GAMM
MAIFNQANTAKKDSPSYANENAQAPSTRETPGAAEFSPTQAAPPRSQAQAEVKESVIASDLTIEGKIEGSGHIRIAGKFKGDVNVKGDLTIEKNAKLNGSVRASKVTVAGELEGNIESAARVELLDSAMMTGDLKAGSLTVAAGSKIRGQVECGWEASDAPKANGKAEHELNS